MHRTTSSLSLVCTPLRKERESTENQLAALIDSKKTTSVASPEDKQHLEAPRIHTVNFCHISLKKAMCGVGEDAVFFSRATSGIGRSLRGLEEAVGKSAAYAPTVEKNLRDKRGGSCNLGGLQP